LAALAPFTIDTLDKQPRAKTLLVDVALHHNAGASVVQELTAAIATATLYLDCLTDSGLDAAMACQQIQFQVACDADILMNVVKLRSLRTIWQHVVMQFIQQTEGNHAFAPTDTRVIAETSQRHLSRDESWINHLRNVSACTAAAIGNTDTIIVHPHDRVDGVLLTNEPVTAQRVARNLPTILEEESGLRTVHDPMGGAYAVENLSQQVCDLVWQFLVDMKDSRGWIAQLASGQWQDALSATHAKRVARLQAEESIKVGVNRYRSAPVPGLQGETGVQQTGSVIQGDALASQSAKAENLKKTHLLAVRESQLFEPDPSGAAAQ
jgi:methylmalonyl-CoA mutase